ncbi:MAG: DNA-binding response regulator [Saprospirales bacterium]|nr:MAG: DNA-binding response regulator [Saprospirales bacterium]
MKCIIIDDEPLAREGIALNLEDIDFIEVIGEFSNPIKANSFLQSNDVDLIFLDIHMPGLNGLDFLRGLNNPPLTILTTAHSEYALQGFELNVVDYLVKPIRMERFIKAVNKAKKLFEMRSGIEKDEPTTEDYPSGKDFVYIKSDRKYVRLLLKEIIMVEGMKDYVMVYTSGDKFTVAMNLKTFNSNLPNDCFVRVSKSNIINVKHIIEISNNHVKLPGHKISIGRSFRDNFLDKHIREKLIERK